MRLQFEKMAHRAAQELSRRLRASNTNRLFGFELEAAEPGRAVVAMRVRERHRQVHGVVHGGIIAALADTTAALAVYMVLPRGTPMATIEMKINFLEPVARGTVTAEGRMLRRGRNFAVAECDVRDHDGRLAAKALLTFAISPSGIPKLRLPPEKKQGRKRRK
jgi:uncharacterized protein (TIGR00369 family)